jgi:hypothetical protein
MVWTFEIFHQYLASAFFDQTIEPSMFPYLLFCFKMRDHIISTIKHLKLMNQYVHKRLKNHIHNMTTLSLVQLDINVCKTRVYVLYNGSSLIDTTLHTSP